MTTKKRKHIYEMLKRYGYTPQKAAEIILDATREVRRGRTGNPIDYWSVSWIRMIFSQRHRLTPN